MEKKFFTLTVRVNEELNEAFSDFSKSKGLTASFAVKRFVQQFVERRELPFSLSNTGAVRKGPSVSMKVYMDFETRAAFSDACKAIDETVTMSHVVRGFMEYCVANNRFPDMSVNA